MKLFCALIMVFLVGAWGVYAQASPAAGSATNELPKIILERDWFHFKNGITWNQYQYLDGTLLKYKNVRSIIAEVPENKTILRREKGWLIANTVSGILLLGSMVTLDVYLIRGDLPYAGTVRWATGWGALLTFATTLLSNSLWEYNMRKAVTNYNLYIQGFPIPTK